MWIWKSTITRPFGWTARFTTKQNKIQTFFLGLTEGTEYGLQVRARTTRGWGDFSTPLYATTHTEVDPVFMGSDKDQVSNIKILKILSIQWDSKIIQPYDFSGFWMVNLKCGPKWSILNAFFYHLNTGAQNVWWYPDVSVIVMSGIWILNCTEGIWLSD